MLRVARGSFLKPRFARFASTPAKSYADTVFLPTTKFGSRSDEKLIETVLKPQTTDKLYEWNIARPVEDINKLFIFHDGPPYANGDLHVGHALNKILKDIINRYELMKGKKVHYVPGWDCHGLPIELKTLEKLNREKKETEKALKKEYKKTKDEKVLEKLQQLKSAKLSPTDIVRLATNHAKTTQASQSEQFQEMTIFGDFKHPYMTLHNSYVCNQLRIFEKFVANGLVRRQEKPVYWGCENATALAEGELEYNKNHVSKAAYVKFPLTKYGNLREKLSPFTDISALIWTSTPWTLASNLAISINENYDYTVIKHNGNDLIVAKDLVPSLQATLGEIIETDIIFKGSELLSCQYKSPILNNGKSYPFLHGTHVTNSAGTGLVHTAPGHGQDDYLVCMKHGIKPYSPVDKYGKYTEDLAESLKDFVGLRVLGDGNDRMIELLDKIGVLVQLDENYVHSYPYDWRSKKPIIIRATPQWFIDVSKIKEKTIKELTDNVNFHPQRGLNRLVSFIRTRNEWCISRQRSWGVPIPVLYHRETGESLLDDKIIEQIISVIEKENIDGWFKQVEEGGSIEKWLPSEYKHLANDYVLGTDTMDVWFDSGSSWKTIERYLKEEGLLNEAEKRGYLADVYLEGSDQHRGWFQSSILTKVGTSETEEVVLPYKNIITHGFTLDEKGEKMSKSIGNTVVPRDIMLGNKSNGIPKIGVDGLRLWVAQSDYTGDVNIGSTILKHVGDNLKKIRFTFKFLLGNLDDKAGAKINYDDLEMLDKYMLSKAYKLNEECMKEYANHNFFKVVKSVNHFINVDLSSVYFDIRKDSLYTDKLDSRKRVSTLAAFDEILLVLVSILSPIIPIMTQEVWNNMPSRLTKSKETPFHNTWYKGELIRINADVEEEFQSLLKLKDQVNLQVNDLKKAGTINQSLECVVSVPPTLHNYDTELLGDVFVVSGIERGEGDLVVKPSPLHKCPRCWKYSAEEENCLCARCQSVVN